MVEDSWRESHFVNLGNDHEFISKKYISIGMKPFGESRSKAMRAYAQSNKIIPLWRSVIPNILYNEFMCILGLDLQVLSKASLMAIVLGFRLEKLSILDFFH